MTHKEFRSRIAEFDERAIFWDDCDAAVIGVVNRLPEGIWVVAYDYDLLVKVFEQKFEGVEDPHSAAVEWVDFNICDAWVGPHTPIIVNNDIFEDRVELELRTFD